MRAILITTVFTLALGCKHPSLADEVNSDPAAAPVTPAGTPAGAAAPTASGQISFLGLLARNNVAGVHMALAPAMRQSRDYTSGAAALQSVLTYWGDVFREGQLAQLLPARPSGDVALQTLVTFVQSLNDAKTRAKLMATAVDGETPGGAGAVHRWRAAPGNGAAYVVDVYAGKDRVLRKYVDTGEVGVPKDGISMSELQHMIDNGWPVIVRLQAWSLADKPAYDGNTDGHYAVVVGYDKSNIYLMDPATTGNYTFLPRAEFVTRWHDSDGADQLRRPGIVIHKDHPAFDFDNVLKVE